jgi:hypothetical protein
MTVARGARDGNESRRRSRRAPPPGHAHGLLATTLAFVMVMGLLGLGLTRATLVAVGNLNLPGPVFVPPAPVEPVVVTPPRRVLTVLVDGLRADMALDLPFIGRLARDGRAHLQAELPTYSAAQYVAALSGVRPADSGVRGNVGLLRTSLDSVPARLRASGRVAIEIGDEVDWWTRLFGDDWAVAEVVDAKELVASARAHMDRADLLLVHLTEADAVGHTLGVADPAYARAARGIDEKIRELALAWGWPDATVVVLSDHGHHWPRGGHGGAEDDVRQTFLVASGPGVRAGGRVEAGLLVDTAPTLAALLGVPAPAQAQGRTLTELLELDASQRTALTTADVARQARVAEAVVVGRQGLLARERRGQSLRGVAVGVCLVLVVVFARRARPRALLGLLVGAASLAVTSALYLVAFETISFSADRDASTLIVNTVYFGFTACTLTFAAPVAAVLTRRLSLTDAAVFGFLSVVGASPAALAMFILCGAFTARITSEPAWLAAGPLLAYGALIPVVLSGALVATTAAVVAILPRPRRARVRAPARVATAPLRVVAGP